MLTKFMSNAEERTGMSSTIGYRQNRKVPQFTRRKTMAAKFDLKQGESGQFLFNLKAGNGEVILTSYERKTAKNGQAFFVLTATGGNNPRQH
jgi:uncharacterized protein YegP (UPF0339 family)